MGLDGTDAEPLSSAEFYALYRGGLSISDETRRLTISHILLASGRLGLRPDELRHLHAGWIDWERGEITIPHHDPCSCADCWASTRRTTDGSSIKTQWQPDAGTERTVEFGWSRRLTGVLATFLDREGWLETREDSIDALIRTAADRAEGLDPDTISFETLLATAGRFFAASGSDTEAIASRFGVSESTAARYARRWGSAPTATLMTRLGDGSRPDPARQFPVVCDPTPFDRELFDPREFDTQWRLDRATDRLDEPRLLETPLPPDDDASVSMGNTLSGHLDKYSEHVTEGDSSTPATTTLPGWRRKVEQQRGSVLGQATTTPASGAAETAASSSASDDTTGSLGDDDTPAHEYVSGAVVAELSATFAAADLGDGKPVSGRVIIGQEELVYVTDENELTIEFADVSDVALDYIPDGLEEVFDSTVGVSYLDGTSKRPSVIDLAADEQLGFATTLLEQVLDGNQAIVTHPAKVGGRVTNNPPQEGTLVTDSGALIFEQDGEPVFDFQREDIMLVERGKQAVPDGMDNALLIRHNTDGEIQTTEISMAEHRLFRLLDRLVMREYKRRKQQAHEISLDDDETEILVALYSVDSGIDISMVIDKPQDRLEAMLDRLESLDLIDQHRTGVSLTSFGRLVVSDRIDDINI